MDDSRIVEMYWQRDVNAIVETDNKYKAYLITICNNITDNDDDTDECLNDTYLGAWNSMPPHRPAILRIYLSKLARRISINAFRKRHREKRAGNEFAIDIDELEDFLFDGTSIEEKYEVAELGCAIGEYLRTVSKRERFIFVSHYYYADPAAKIGRMLGVSESTVFKNLANTRKSLRKFLVKGD